MDYKKKIVLLVLVSVILITFVIDVQAGKIDSFDERIQDIVRERNDGFVGSTMGVITDLGKGEFSVAIAGALPDHEARNDSYKAMAVGGISVTILKYGIGRSRPRAGDIEYKPLFSVNDSAYRSFPSGHTTTAFALATTIANHYPDYKWYSYGLATLVGISRIYEEAHWASDVVAGAGLGYASAKFVEYHW